MLIFFDTEFSELGVEPLLISIGLVAEDGEQTHFAPHPGCVAPEHQDSDVSPYFVTDLSRLMEKHQITVWCHGHTHTNNDFIAENGCRVVSNQLGYPGERTRTEFGMQIDTGFRNELVIEL